MTREESCADLEACSRNVLGSLEENELWGVLSRKRAAGDDVFDLITESNPTRVGLTYSGDEILAALAQPEALTSRARTARTRPPRGKRSRVTTSNAGKDVSPDDIVLTAGTSEAYSFLFKLLCGPGDEVLVPRPSYPLVETLASLEAVEPVPYSLDHGLEEPLSRRCRRHRSRPVRTTRLARTSRTKTAERLVTVVGEERRGAHRR